MSIYSNIHEADCEDITGIFSLIQEGIYKANVNSKFSGLCDIVFPFAGNINKNMSQNVVRTISSNILFFVAPD